MGPLCSTWSLGLSRIGAGIRLERQVVTRGFTVSGSLATWQWGVPTSGPNAAHRGSKVWATNLSGNYRAGEDSYLTSPVIDLSAHAGHAITLSWWEYAYTFSGTARVEVSKDGGLSWALISTSECLCEPSPNGG
jgi:hypothetical protein